MQKTVIHTEDAPAAIGPYQQAIKSGGFVFASGQIAIDPSNGELITTSIEAETTQVLQNVESVLKAAGSSLQQVVKASIFMSSMDHYAAINDVYGRFFKAPYPAREAVAVKTLPKSVNVEISVIAIAH